MPELTTELFDRFKGSRSALPGQRTIFTPRGWVLIQDRDRSFVVCGALDEAFIQERQEDPKRPEKRPRRLIVRFRHIVRRMHVAANVPGWLTHSQNEFEYDPYLFRAIHQPSGVLRLTSAISGELLLFVPW